MMTNMSKVIIGGLVLAAIVLLLMDIIRPPTMGIPNPAAVYCEELGYEYIVESTPQGEMGLCKLPNGETVSDWDFLKGKVAEEYSYCHQEGYEIKTVRDSGTCSKFGTVECAVCVLEDGTEVEVTELMGLEFSCPECIRIPLSTILIVAALVAVAVAIGIVLFLRKRATQKSK